MGRIRYNYSFEEARELVRGEKIGSRQQYYDWYDLHKPARIPRRPDRSYPKEWITWNDYLGNNNPFPCIRKHFRKYNEAKMFAHTLNLKTKQEWLDFAKSGKRPVDIPSRPDVYYQKSGQWFTWNEFLGYSVKDRIKAIQESTNNIFFIIRYPNTQSNIYGFGTTNGGISALKNEQINKKFQIIKTFNCIENFMWINVISTKCTPYYGIDANNLFIVPNLFDILYDLNETGKIQELRNVY